MDQHEKNTQHEENFQITLTPKPIKWIIPDSIRTDHATHLVVQQQGSEFMLLFFETQQPIFTGSAEEQRAAYEKLSFNEAKCVAKIVMSAESMAASTNSLLAGLSKLNDLLVSSLRGQENADRTQREELSSDI